MKHALWTIVKMRLKKNVVESLNLSLPSVNQMMLLSRFVIGQRFSDALQLVGKISIGKAVLLQLPESMENVVVTRVLFFSMENASLKINAAVSYQMD